MVRDVLTPARAVMGIFFMHGFVLSNWFPRIPDVQTRLGVGPADLSIGLVGMSLGFFIAFTYAGPLIHRIGPRPAIIGAYGFCNAAIVLPGWAWNVPSLFIALALIGLSYPVIDIAMNVEATRIQASGTKRILSTCHGFWSIGAMTGALVGSGFAQAGIATGWHLLIICAISTPIAMGLGLSLPVMAPIPGEAEVERGPAFALPSRSVIGICVVIFGTVIVEMTSRNWSAIYLRDLIGVSPAATGLGYASFALFMSIGRFMGDRLTDRFGPVVVARNLMLVALVGAVLIVVGQNLAEVVLGFAAAGLGVSVAFPLGVAAAASRGDRPAPINVAALSLAGNLSSLAGPPIVGFIAEAAGLRFGLATLLPAIAIAALLAGQLKIRGNVALNPALEIREPSL